jgi:hypothetical protein
MTQPSVIDVGLPESSLLFAARSSPFICVADALSVLFELAIHIWNGNRLREAARRINWRRARLRLRDDEITTLEENPAKAHPKTFLILFIATLLQAIKISGCQGMFWMQLWVGIYLCSYFVLAAVQFLAPADYRNRPTAKEPFEYANRVVDFFLCLLALIVHACACSWAIFQVAHLNDHRLSRLFEDYSDAGVMGLHTVYVCFATVVYLVEFLVPAILVITSLSRISGVSILPKYIKLFSWILVLPVVLYIHIKVDVFSNTPPLWATVARIAAQGGGAAAVCLGILILFLKGLSSASDMFGPMIWLKPQPGVPSFIVVFPFFNLLMAFLYYRFVYDPAGTVKSSWTENLG